MAEVEDREGLSILEEQIPYFFNNIEEKYKYARKHCEDHYTDRKLLFERLLKNDFPTDNDPVIEDNELVDDNLVSDSTLKSTRKRKASRLASLKIKRNVNIPLKLRRSRRTGNVFDRSLKVNEELKKGNCSKDRNLSDSEWETDNDNTDNDVIAAISKQAEEAPQPVQRQHEDKYKKVVALLIAARKAAYAKHQLAVKEDLQKKGETIKAAAVALQKNLEMEE